ncbi:hypothetical protein Bpfe_017945 [Biomphalaria pfeifferi]|uniref:Uncharacterized protein n=1 Tax=Biomphalaria pfeifferi TaxID=112525 RepID=A0AAD8BDP7_BIOPF|nr:hypothetical protein Bpfe_017945 [Biomphalaria pfeifferi]
MIPSRLDASLFTGDDSFSSCYKGGLRRKEVEEPPSPSTVLQSHTAGRKLHYVSPISLWRKLLSPLHINV